VIRPFVVNVLAAAQAALGAHVAWRLLRTGGQRPLQLENRNSRPSEQVAVIVPVLDEAERLGPCLEGLLSLGPEVGEILVVDGGSRDATNDIVRAFMRREPRLRLVEAGVAPSGWNGKVWGLWSGERALTSRARWLLTLDADARPAPGLVRALVERARSCQVGVLSVATAQHVSSNMDGLLHPSLLATLVYRFGRPSTVTRDPHAAMANGQCCLIRRELLESLGGFRVVCDSLCEDVTLARLAARAGEPVGFVESDGLITAHMYSSWRKTWRNWPRSLALRDSLSGARGWLGLVEAALVQALPLPVLLASVSLADPKAFGVVRRVNLFLAAMRLGVLIGMARAYPARPWSYWLSPLADVPSVLAIWRSALATRHAWRGRTYVRRKGSLIAA
jgi:dolichol-phosphate mannosyltransferase